jgi:hypothetical protein
VITLSIDVTLLDKARFKEVVRKNGSKAVFCDLVLFETQSEYGDYIVKQNVTKEERAARIEMPILGNGKIWEKRAGSPAPRTTPPRRAATPDAPPNGTDYGPEDPPF